jgi:DNA topoisomerase VI subunit B
MYKATTSGRMMEKLERTIFETSRAAEYFTAEGLTKLTEQSEESFGDVVIKELGDNALDAAETTRVVPELLIRCERRGELTDVSISDNGEGIPPETVESMQNFDTLTSDKAHYRTPTRGAQGNALKTIIGIPHALGLGGEPVVIEGRGLRHTIKPVIDAAGVPRLPLEIETIDKDKGTRVTVSLPHERINLDPSYWAKAFALFNSHAFVKIEQFGQAVERVNGSRKRLNLMNRPR